MIAQDHPDKEQLSGFASGLLEPDLIEQVGIHLDTCDSCRQTLREIPNDSFVSLVRECKTYFQEKTGDNQGTVGLEEESDNFAPTEGVATQDGDTPEKTSPQATVSLDPKLLNHPRYEIEELIGLGGMGAIYKAVQLRLDRTVALKVINSELTANQAAVDRFHREVQAAGRLDHPNIVTAYDADQAGDTHFFVMEYVPGDNLSTMLKEKGPLSIKEATIYMRQVALGLQHAHERGMVHRDIKPQNLMLTPEGQIKILDFGLASLISEPVIKDTAIVEASQLSKTMQLTQAGVVMGTPDYMAPEQAQNASSADIRSDIYSLGCTFYYLLTGRAPFPEKDSVKKLKAHATQEPTKIRTLRPDVPPRLRGVIRKMMAKDPADRYQTPAEVAVALEQFTTSENEPASAGQEKASRRWPLLTALASAALLLLIIAATVLYFRTPQGTVRIEINDPKIKVTFGEKTFSIDNDGETIHFKPGKHTLSVQRGDLKFTTKEFSLGSGENPALKVELLKGKDVLVVSLGEKQLAEERLPQELELIRKLTGNVRSVRAIRLLPNGEAISFCAQRYIARIRKWKDGAEDCYFAKNLPSKTMWHSAAFSKDGKYLVIGEGGSGFSQVQFWDLDSDQVFWTKKLGLAGNVIRLEFAPNGEGIVVVRRKAPILLLDSKDGKTLQMFQDESQKNHQAASFSPDGNMVCFFYNEQNAGIFRVSDGKKILEFRDYIKEPSAAAWSSDGRTIIVGDSSGDLHACDAKTGKRIDRWSVEKSKINTLFFDSSGKRLFCGGAHRITIWDYPSKKLLAYAHTPNHEGLFLSLSSDERTLLSGGGWWWDNKVRDSGDYALRLWRLPVQVDLSNNPSKPEIVLLRKFEGHTGPVKDLAYSSDGKFSASGSGYFDGDKTARIWNMETGKLLHTLPHNQKVMSLAFSPDNKYLATGTKNKELTLWNVLTGELVRRFSENKEFIDSVAFSLDGKEVYVGGHGNCVVGFHVETGKQLASLDGPQKTLLQVAITSDGKYILAASRDSRVYVWSRKEKKLIRSFPNDPSINVAGVGMVLLPNGRVLVGDGEKKLRLFDWRSGKLIREISIKSGVQNISASPDGRFAYLAGGKSVALVDLQTWEIKYHDTGLKGGVWDVAPSPDGTKILTAGGSYWTKDGWISSGDYALRLWKLPRSMWPRSTFFPGTSGFVLTSDDYVWTNPVNLGPRVNSKEADGNPWVSADEKTLLFSSTRPGSLGAYDIWKCTRKGIDEDWSKPVHLGEPINSRWFESNARISPDGRTLIFVSTRPFGYGAMDLWMATRDSTDAEWGKPINLGPKINSPKNDSSPNLSADGLQLKFRSNRTDRFANWISKRESVKDPWPAPELLPNSKALDGNLRFLDSGTTALCNTDAPEIFLCRWNAIKRLWEKVGKLPPPINEGSHNSRPHFNPLTKTLYFESDRPGGLGDTDLWMARRLPKDSQPSWKMALAFDGKTSRVETPVHFDPNQPFTMEAWVKAQTTIGHQLILANLSEKGGATLETLSDDEWWKLAARFDGTFQHARSKQKIVLNRWYHLAGVWNGDRWSLYVNGKLQQTIGGGKHQASAIPFSIGASSSRAPGGKEPGHWEYHFNGLIDEVRFSKVVRYEGDFSPELHFSADKDTIALYHLDEGNGNKLHDASGNQLHGEIYGATWIGEGNSHMKSNIPPRPGDKFEPKVRDAIRKGLDYLARTQHADGHWEGKDGNYPVAMTALAAMAMMMEGSTVHEGPYADSLRKALNWLLSKSQKDGRIVDPTNKKERNHYMFGHGYAMMVLSSALGDEPDFNRQQALRKVLTKAVQFTAKAQTPRGGWGYVAAAEGNNYDEVATSLTQLQGLRAARNNGIPVPRKLLDSHYLRKFTGPNGGVLYSLNGVSERPALTAAALAACEYDSELFKKWLGFCQRRIPLPPKRKIGHDIYLHYYYAQALYNLGEKGYARLFPNSQPEEHLTWSKYRKAIFDDLVSKQTAEGSWVEGNFGPVYPTACNLTILQLENNLIDIYQRDFSNNAD